jgi:hypothetical protein
MTNPHAPMWLYRLSDRYGELLYVGITCDVPRRMSEHAADKAWWPEVAGRPRVVPIRPRGGETPLAAALRLERWTIVAEHPRYNIVHNGARVRVTTAPRRPPSPRRARRTQRRAARRSQRGSMVWPLLWALVGGFALWCTPSHLWAGLVAVVLFVLALRSADRHRRPR